MAKRDESRFKKVFRDLREKGGKALVTFVTAGDPDMETSRELIFALEKGGADIIELGIPFSDPMADGPTIQASYERALKEGATLPGVLRLVKEVRRKSSIPIVLFGYYNPIFTYGLKGFAEKAKEAGVDGVLVVDLPPEEAGELKRELRRVGLDLIFLLTPTSDHERMRLVSSEASGFIYFVSLTGVTGARERLSTGIGEALNEIRKYTRLPVGVGFGISKPEQAREVCQWADGAVVGSAIINIIAHDGNRKRMVREVERFVSSLKKGIL